MRVLLVCRDAGAAQQLLAVAAAQDASPTSRAVELRALVDGPARQAFHCCGIPVDTIDRLSAGATHRAFEESLDAYLRHVVPQAVLTGVSAPGPSLEEAVTHAARRVGIPVIAFQDYWGCGHDDPHAIPDMWLVLDDEAARLTRAQYPHARIEVVGSPRHDALVLRDLPGLQPHWAPRRMPGGPALVMFAGQPLWHLPAYETTLRDTARVLATRGQSVTVRYAPHPAETDCRPHVEQVFGDEGISVQILPMQDVIATLCDIDVLITAFSSCAWDLLQLHRHEGLSPAVPVCAMWDPQIQQAHAAYAGGHRTVPYRALLGELLVTSQDDLDAVIGAALEPGMRDILAARIRSALPPRETSAAQRAMALMQLLVP